ncbi:MAG TPA: iron chelate uptake ABC transporter family permease subunit [Atopostipes sp.]|nr:iron chelate uptake ABC transporter family permease subunit [Atopostipes sp.]
MSLFFIITHAHYFSIKALGHDLVTGLGISSPTFRLIGIILVALGSASVLLTVGNIPFIGIVIPNLVSLRYGDYFKKTIFPGGAFGMIFLLCADILARVLIFPFE